MEPRLDGKQINILYQFFIYFFFNSYNLRTEASNFVMDPIGIELDPGVNIGKTSTAGPAVRRDSSKFPIMDQRTAGIPLAHALPGFGQRTNLTRIDLRLQMVAAIQIANRLQLDVMEFINYRSIRVILAPSHHNDALSSIQKRRLQTNRLHIRRVERLDDLNQGNVMDNFVRIVPGEDIQKLNLMHGPPTAKFVSA